MSKSGKALDEARTQEGQVIGASLLMWCPIPWPQLVSTMHTSAPTHAHRKGGATSSFLSE